MDEFLPGRSIRFFIAVILVLVSAAVPGQVEARVRVYRWDVNYEYKSSDCYSKLAITINGESPGPTIRAQQGDTVVVRLHNSLLTENVAVHWHGIRQIGTPWMDGTEAVTQCPIQPGETFEYRFVVDRPGTYLYHAHYGMQKQAGLYGMIEVALPNGESEPYSYDFDRSIILTDLYHRSTYEQAAGLSSIPFVWVGEPQSILIQGRGRFNCSTPGIEAGVCNATSVECEPHTLTVTPGKTYRLRIGSLTSLAALSVEIEGHNMTVVEADGHNVEPFSVKNLFIYSGETYSVLIKADQNPSRNYWLAAKVVARNSTTPQGLAILNYIGNNRLQNPPTVPPVGPLWNDDAARVSQSLKFKALRGYIHAPPPTADRTIVMLNTQNRVNGRVRWSINNVSFALPHTPYLISFKENLLRTFDQTPPPETYDYESYDIFSVAQNVNATIGNGVYRLQFNSTVDIILQNANTMNRNNSEAHPWHMHGHDFWVLGYGAGKFNGERDGKKFNLKNPIMKNTVVLHPYGWTALRFRADNPGVWAFHCHIESHFFMGMGVVFEEGIERVGKLPASIGGCGHARGLGSHMT